MPNALLHETSPYLRQHAHNPVDWVPWGDAAFEKAQRENKPVFLSIGYTACHWCHVMERESFENEEIAALLNRYFVAVKVDREERPDVDHYYMQSVQLVAGQGGWPLSVFVTPERRAFFGGTYWPPVARWGRPGFRDVLNSVANAWRERRGEVMASAEEIHHATAAAMKPEHAPGELSAAVLDDAVQSAAQRFDAVHGGFGPAPKFPHPTELTLLLRLGARSGMDAAGAIALHTLRQMAAGGICDQLGGGFHRYSTDAEWRVPHFEKMLYDNALLVPALLDAYTATGEDLFREVAAGTLEWCLREMLLPEGGFASSLDADSEGEEGRFYVWRPDEVTSLLGRERGARFCRVYDVTAAGNFGAGRSVLHRAQPLTQWAAEFAIAEGDLAEELAEDREALRTARNLRVRPERDDKLLSDSNGLMLSALVRGFAVLDDERYLTTAQRLAERLMFPFEATGRLPHAQIGGHAGSARLLLDYAAVAQGLLDLYGAGGDHVHFRQAAALADEMERLFSAPDGLYYMSAESVAETRGMDVHDSSLPSGVALAAHVHATLFLLTGDGRHAGRAGRALEPLTGLMRRAPSAFSQALLAADLLLHSPVQLVCVGDASREFWRIAQICPVPGMIVVWHGESAASEESVPLLQGKTALGGKPTAYLCRDFACHAPVTSAADLRAALREAVT